MKALKNDSTIYTEQIVSAVTECYSKNPEPSNRELMKLYAFIGQNICEQGEKAFVVYLAQILADQLPQMKGFSPRNLRRMRDFYRTYENSPALMKQTQLLGWTQNSVILECCETNDQRAFYICLAIEQNLSKLTLVKAIEFGTFETTSATQTHSEDLGTACPAVSDKTTEEAVDTTLPTEKPCGAFVTACEPLRQGSGLHIGEKLNMTTNYRGQFGSKKRSLSTALEKLLELPIDWRGYLKRHLKQIWQNNCQWANASPPSRWRYYFERPKQSTAFA